MDSVTLEVVLLVCLFVCLQFLSYILNKLTFLFLVHILTDESTGEPKTLFPRKNYSN